MANLIFRASLTPTTPGASSLKNAPLTNLEVDGNFKSIDDDLSDKLTLSGGAETVGGVKTFSEAVILSTQASIGTHAVRADRSIATGNGLTGGGNLTSNRTISLVSISAGSTSVGAIGYNGVTKDVGKLYGGTTNPTGTNRLNYDGHLYATQFYGDGTQLTGVSSDVANAIQSLSSGLDASNLSSGTIPGARGSDAGSTASSFLTYNGTTRTAGRLYGGTISPTASNRLNYDGDLHATRFYGNGLQLNTLNASELTSGTVPGARGVDAGSTVSSFLTYNGTTRVVGRMYGGTTDPTGTTRLNYDGLLRPTRVQTDSIGVGTSASATIGEILATSATFSSTVIAPTFSGALTGNATTATRLQTARTIGGVSFNGSANINLPGVNTAGNQNTSGNAATATSATNAATATNVAYAGLTGVVPTWNQSTTGNATTATRLQTARTIGGVSFNGSANINLPGVNTAGNQNTSGNAATATNATNVVGGNVACNGIQVTSAAPTIWMYDTDQADFAMHVNSNLWYVLNQGGAGIMYVDQGGNFTAAGNVTAYSDARLKNNIVTIEDALQKVKSIRGVSFEKDGKSSIGVIAQEIQEVVPEVVQENADGYLSVAYGNLVGLLIEAIKDLSNELEEVKTKIQG